MTTPAANPNTVEQLVGLIKTAHHCGYERGYKHGAEDSGSTAGHPWPPDPWDDNYARKRIELVLQANESSSLGAKAP